MGNLWAWPRRDFLVGARALAISTDTGKAFWIGAPLEPAQ